MKFGHNFSEALQKEEYPAHWIESAISYRQLKKCIKKVQLELSTLGLDPETLNELWESMGTTTDDDAHRPVFNYSFEGNTANFRPRLTFVLDPKDGLPIDARLSPETRVALQHLSKSRGCTKRFSTVSSVDGSSTPTSSDGEEHIQSLTEGLEGLAVSDEHVETIEIPLASDGEFFQILNKELSNLETLQKRERSRLTQQISKVGQEVSRLANKTTDKSKGDLYAWREIFRLYIESEIFFSTNELDHGARDAATAQKNLEKFSMAVGRQRSQLKLGRSGRQALEQFMLINIDLVRNLKFQDINRTAMNKILKKFDKRTALHAQLAWPRIMADAPYMAETMAKAVCFEVSEELLTVVPQLDDYLCPICTSISFKPIRLPCGHVFCIRCMILMQRSKQDRCPMCRDGNVMVASSYNLDTKLMAFLQEKFPKEVKEKQKENEHAAGVDRYGEEFNGKCMVM